jgi:hypothetical protein
VLADGEAIHQKHELRLHVIDGVGPPALPGWFELPSAYRAVACARGPVGSVEGGSRRSRSGRRLAVLLEGFRRLGGGVTTAGRGASLIFRWTNR